MTVPKNVTNSFISSLYNGLKKFCSVNWMLPNFHNLNSINDCEYDIINIHWPEALFNWKEPTVWEIAQLSSYLNLVKKKSKIVYNVHNEFPHNRDTQAFRDLYSLIIDNADMLIHLSDTSYNFYKNLNGKNHCVIPQGNFDNFPNRVTRNEARQHFGFAEDEFVILSFGHIRGKDEIQLLLKAFQNFPFNKKKLLVARGNLLQSGNFLLRQFEKIKFALSNSIIWDPRHIADEEVQYFLNACDSLFLPRIKSLNSASLVLGFTFGKVVIGPTVGSIGEILMKTGNPSFNPTDLDSVQKALTTGFYLSKQNKGKENKEYADINWNWNNIASKYYEAFNGLVKY